MAGPRELPNHADLQPFGHAAAGHDGTLSDPDGELFIKPCVQQEIDFYETAFQNHPDFAHLMPGYLGTLSLNDATDVDSVNEQLPAVAEHLSQALKEEAVAQAKEAAAEAVTPSAADAPTPPDNIQWKPNKNRKITTNKSVVLENTTHGYKKPNILDAKLGRRLWADDAPLEKRKRFDEISRVTTNGSHGFRIAGMRVYKGADDPAELDEEGYKVYNKDYGRLHVNKDNLVDEIRKFIFNERAGIDRDLGLALAEAFLDDLRTVEEVMSRSETRMYSASLLFTYEGDVEALREAVVQQAEIAKASAAASQDGEGGELKTEAIASAIEKTSEVAKEKYASGNAEVVSGPIVGDVKVLELAGDVLADGEDEDEDEVSSFPRIYSLKLIDFAHAEWVPGQGPDENSLLGVRSLIKIFEELVR